MAATSGGVVPSMNASTATEPLSLLVKVTSPELTVPLRSGGAETALMTGGVMSATRATVTVTVAECVSGLALSLYVAVVGYG